MYALTYFGSPFSALAYASFACWAKTSRSSADRFRSVASSVFSAAICTQVAGLGSPRGSRLMNDPSEDGGTWAALGGGGGVGGVFGVVTDFVQPASPHNRLP